MFTIENLIVVSASIALLSGLLGLTFAEVDCYLSSKKFNIFAKTLFGVVSDWLFNIFIAGAVIFSITILVCLLLNVVA